ncbi:universal stress protein [Ekhidna sp. To15]|uniref:universal stress protein n=1 Tax=Ekhidna sp. To15 TaxID=3395267 RepID=UPI003F522005
MKKILVPVDFSHISTSATQFAIELAEKHDAEITLLNSVHFDYYSDYQFTSFSSAKSLMEEVREAMVEKMKEFTSKFNTKIKINTKIDEVYLVSAIKEMTKEEGYDLVIIGTKGCSGLEEVLIGSNTEKIVRHAACPVISIPDKVSVSEIKKILIPLDIREIKASFLNEVSKLQKSFKSKLEFLWVKTPHNIENEERVSNELSKQIQSHDITDFEFTIVNNVFPSDGILSYAQEIEANMIAMPTHARRGLSHWLSGSLTEDTVNHINVPVWSFRMDKKEKSISLDSIKNAHGKPEYKKIEVLTHN